MKTFLPFFLLVLLLLLGFVVQDTLPAMPLLGGAHILFVPVIFCFAALALSFSEALLFALITAVILSLMVMQFPGSHVEIQPGWFIFFFIVWAILLQFFSDLTEGVRWELHAIGSAFCTATLLFGEFILLSLKRGGFLLTGRTLMLMLISAGASLFLAPLFYSLLQFFLLPAIPDAPAKKTNF